MLCIIGTIMILCRRNRKDDSLVVVPNSENSWVCPDCQCYFSIFFAGSKTPLQSFLGIAEQHVGPNNGVSIILVAMDTFLCSNLPCGDV